MEKYFLFKREMKEEPDHSHIFFDEYYSGEPTPKGFLLDKIVDTEEDVLEWLERNYYSTFKVIKGEELEFNISTETTVSVKIQKK